MLSIHHKDWKECCDIIEKLEEIGDCEVFGTLVRMLCANNDNCIDLVIGQYSEVLDNGDGC